MTYLDINGVRLSIEEVAEKFGIPGKLARPSLCQEVPAGMLRVTADNNVPFCGVDVQLVLPAEAQSLPIKLCRAEQPNPDGEAEVPTVFLYGRGDSYVALMQVDTRPDEQEEEAPKNARITISGDPGDEVHVFAENQYVTFSFQPDPQNELPF